MERKAIKLFNFAAIKAENYHKINYSFFAPKRAIAFCKWCWCCLHNAYKSNGEKGQTAIALLNKYYKKHCAH